SGSELARNLGGVLIRRLMDAEKYGEPIPPFRSPFPVSLVEIAAFLNGHVDDTKLEDLLWGLSLVEHDVQREVPDQSTDAELPSIYALLKLTLLPGRLEWFKHQSGDPVLRINSPLLDDSPGGIAVKS